MIKIFSYGNCKDDFPYAEDLIEGMERIIRKTPDFVTGENG